MRKIPTVYRRDPENMARVLDEVNPGCEWVLAGEGQATRKYDGTCLMLDEDGRWWARREVKPGKRVPSEFIAVETDPATGKTVGWEPVEQSSFLKAFLAVDTFPTAPGTYELCGPKINGNPEDFDLHELVRHDTADPINLPPRLDFRTLQRALTDLRNDHGIEGIVWHHPDGRMAKLKGRDFA